MTFKKAVEDFVNIYNRFSDYWQMQLCWASYVTALRCNNIITEHQCQNWGNPCTPETFKRWCNKWYGLRSNYECVD